MVRLPAIIVAAAIDTYRGLPDGPRKDELKAAIRDLAERGLEIETGLPRT